MQRMLSMVGPNLSAVCAENVRALTWNGSVPAVSLNPQYSLFDRVKLRLGLMEVPSRIDRAREALRRFEPRKILLHYLHYAATFESMIESCDQDVYIHCHGCDITWNLRDHRTPEKLNYDCTYLDSVRNLSRNAILIANSEYSKQQLVDAGVLQDRIVVKRCGVPAPSQPTFRQNKWPIEILYLGRLIDSKGPDLTIKAFELACDRGLDARLTLAGDGDMRVTCELMRTRSRHADRIRLLGAVDERTGIELRVRSDIFTAHNCVGPLTRQTEALGVSILEAMAEALPVVTGKSGGLVEAVVDGETGILVEPGDVNAHAEALLLLATTPDLRRRMGEAGWRRIKEHFSLGKERSQLLRILDLGRSEVRLGQESFE
jgi:glycosyltransferase involved in cell wall biosynthesis